MSIDLESLNAIGFTDYDVSNDLASVDDAVQFLNACLNEAGEDAAFIAHALGKVAKSRVLMANIAATKGLSRESLYKALSGKRDPSLSTFLKVVHALGLRLAFHAGPPVATLVSTSGATLANAGEPVDVPAAAASPRNFRRASTGTSSSPASR